jgi:hypothetical protein
MKNPWSWYEGTTVLLVSVRALDKLINTTGIKRNEFLCTTINIRQVLPCHTAKLAQQKAHNKLIRGGNSNCNEVLDDGGEG